MTMNPLERVREATANRTARLPAVPATGAAGDALVSVRGAAARVGGRTLWSGVDLDVHAGEFVAVLGPNGVGKTALIKVLLGLVRPSAGELRVLGRPPGRANHSIGYLPQRRGFDATLPLRGVDIVRLGLDGDRWGTPLPLPAGVGARRRAARQRIAAVLDLVGASAYAHRPIGACSGGEQQRLLIAQALVCRPELLLLDEPLESLDLSHQGAVAALIARICREERVGVVMVAHDVNPILPYVDQVVYIAEGRAAVGTPEEVITTETLSRLYDTPVEVLHTRDGRLAVVGTPETPAAPTDGHPHRDSADPP
ncbi:metal ABC transporter ATP-binding protein [Streptomyces sp. NPDC002851]